MTVTRANDYANGTDFMDGDDIIQDLDAICSELNTHTASNPVGHANGSVGANALGTGAVTSVKLGADAVTAAKINDLAVQREHLVVGRAYSHTGAGAEVTQGGLVGVYTVTTAATDADGSVIKDSNNLGAADDTYKDMIMVILSYAADASAVGRRFLIASSSQANTSITLQTEALGGGNLGDAPIFAVGDTFAIVKTPICAVHIGDNEIRTEHILNGEITMAKCAAEVPGWHGSATRLKLLPSDFVTTDPSKPEELDVAGQYALCTTVVVATVAIPTGYKATAVMVYGNDATNDVEIFACEINDGTTATSKGTGHVGTEIDITDVTATTTNYLAIWVATATGDQIHGGYVTIAKV